MSKHALEGVDPEATQKKRKINNEPPVEIGSARELQLMLAFRQDGMQELRTGLKTFKQFLESILYAEDRLTTASQQAILKDFLEREAPAREGAPFLQDFMQAWSFAAQTNNDGLLSAITANIALLLKTISALVDFRDIGRALISTLLDQAQLKHVARSLSAPKHKGHVISPSLRLLTEVVSFDGGAMARKTFAARIFTFDPKILARNLSITHSGAELPSSSSQSPSVRSNTVNYLLANLKFQPVSIKIEILKQNIIFKALFDHVRYDGPDTIRHIFGSLQTDVVNIEEIPRKTKGFLFSLHNLVNIAGIYRRPQKANGAEPASNDTIDLVDNFLTSICTNPKAGVLRLSSGFYPPGSVKHEDDSVVEDEIGDIDLGLDSVGWYTSFKSQVPVRNTVLSGFLQQLKPYSSDRERRLLLGVFTQAPELVADYFFKSSFAFDPKLTATWIGYSAFIFSVLQQPLPSQFGRGGELLAVPPPVSIVLESILPQPLNSKTMTKCLNQSSELITYFAIRILVIAFQKLQSCLELLYHTSSSRGKLWTEAAERLQEAFASRCPKTKDIIAAFRKTSPNNKLQREATLHLLRLYYTVTPKLAAEEKFDVSVVLDQALDNLEKSIDVGNQVSGLDSLELNHLLEIAKSTAGSRWWHKPEALRFTPFVCLLKILAAQPDANASHEMKGLLFSLSEDFDLLQSRTSPAGLDALLASLKPTASWNPSEAVFTWLDDVLGRFTKKTIKYLDDLDAVKEEAGCMSPVSPIWAALAEQLPFALSRSQSAEEIVKWLSRYLSLSKAIGEDDQTLSKLRSTLTDAEGMTKEYKNIMKSSSKTDSPNILGSPPKTSEDLTSPKGSNSPISTKVSVHSAHFSLPANGTDPSNDLHRASSMEISEAVSSGALGSLMLCLSSTDHDIRDQALVNLNSILRGLQSPQAQSAYPQAKQMYLLIGVLCNTASHQIKASKSALEADDSDGHVEGDADQLAIPYLVTVFAAMAASVLAEPTHPLYAKVNKFLLRGPSWDPKRLPTYWVHALLRSPPSDTVSAFSSTMSSSSTGAPASSTTLARFDRTLHPITTLPPTAAFPNSPYHAGVQFLLSYFYHALRTPTDLAIMRRRSTFEPVFALVSDPFMAAGLRDLVIGIVWRTSFIDGGSTTLITRAGVLAWLGSLIGDRSGKGSGLSGAQEAEALVKRLWETCEKQRVEDWAGGTVNALVEQLAGRTTA